MTTTSLCPAYTAANYESYRPRQPAVQPTSDLPSSARDQSSAALAAQLSETSASLTVMTDDGDRVTLSFSARSLLAAVQFGAEADGVTVAGESLTNARASQLSVSVEGDLDKEEMSDLTRLFRKFARALKDLFQGNPQRAAERMTRIRGLDSLEGFTYSMAQQKQTLVRTAERAAG